MRGDGLHAQTNIDGTPHRLSQVASDDVPPPPNNASLARQFEIEFAPLPVISNALDATKFESRLPLATDVQPVSYEQDPPALIPTTQRLETGPPRKTAIARQTPVVDVTQNAVNATQAPSNTQGQNTFLQSQFQSRQQASDIGSSFYRTNEDFSQGLVVHGKDVAMKIGGYVKLDLIYDFNPIDSTDLFDVGSIPVGAPPRTNSRMHARQTRLSFDTRWKTDAGTVRTLVEGDFFSDGDRFRLRHAYGELDQVLAGRTTTAFANIDAAPATLDFEGSVSAITSRRAQVRWTRPLWFDDLTLALAVEDATVIIDAPPGITGQTRPVSPDGVARLRWTRSNGNLQIAGIARVLGFQPTGAPVLTDNAWGLNFSQVAEISPNNKFYWQINYGDGIGSFLGLPDITPTGPDTADLLGYFGWMLGTTHEWSSKLSSNFTFAESHFRNTVGQPLSDINNLTYVASNVIWTPVKRINVGIEYLYGKRENINGASGIANRIQFAVFYYLP